MTIITVGSLKEEYLQRGIEEYKKRIGAFAKVEQINLKEERIADETDPSQIQKALAAEGQRILDKVEKDSFFVPLCIEGKMMDSPTLAAALAVGASKSGKLTFAIGSSHGLAPAVKARGDLRLSISPLTFPHQLMRLNLYEILYRCLSISAGRAYHK